MNRRKINRARILRHRRRGTTPNLLMTLPNGTYATVRPSLRGNGRALYRSRYAAVFGEWPPGPKTVAELVHWS